jgi:hypothetical protein
LDLHNYFRCTDGSPRQADFSRHKRQLIHDQLGYPVYFIQFISYAKVIGVAVILIPGLNRSVKEWAYAGLFFDLAGAIYSGIASSGKFDPLILTMLVWILPGLISYAGIKGYRRL